MSDTEPVAFDPQLPAAPINHCHVVIDDASGEVLEYARTTLDPGVPVPAPTLAPGQSCLAVTPEVYESVRSGRPHKLVDGQIVPFVREVPLSVHKTNALSFVDIAAEQARLAFITGGAGQALEYQQTEWEARAWGAASEPELIDYPFLKAEVDAIAETTGQAPDPDEVAATVIAQADAWKAAGSEIKRLRRTAKLTIEAAATSEEIAAAQIIPWPSPQ